MIELNYEVVKSDILNCLNKQENIVLSTCAKNKVTSRMMCFANDGLVVYLLTAKNSTKCKQIEENENVSLCIDNLQIEGKARIIGNPMEENNTLISKAFRTKHTAYYERFAHFKFATLIEVQCANIKQWKMESGRDYFYCLDAVKEKAIKHT